MKKIFLICIYLFCLTVFAADINQLHIWTYEEKITAEKLNNDIEQIINTINDIELDNFSSDIKLEYRKLSLDGYISNSDLVSGIIIENFKFNAFLVGLLRNSPLLE